MVRVRNVFLNYEDRGEMLSYLWGVGRNVFSKYELGAKRLAKKWCELTMGRKVCVPMGRYLENKRKMIQGEGTLGKD